ncbi:MAG TPA: glycosyltransferase [Solirubrobacteraceae bacterium]|nr:glycosyltransferase [Solirubrobacteraceae bacterium]
MTGVWALVVTRNRKQLLTECLQALLGQTHPVAGIIVFDNGSTDGTVDWLRARGLMGSPRLRFERSEVNGGGAGGFAQALRLGCATEAEWLWLMDDDAEPDPDALERLLSSSVATDPTTVALCTRVVHRDRSTDPLHRCRLRQFITPLPAGAYAPGTHVDVDCASFVGLLLRGDGARAAGLPRAEFFLGYDDAEYCLRLRALGRIRLVPESVVTHKLVVGGGQRTWRCALWNRVLGTDYTSSPWEDYWKDLYRVRNLVVLRVAHGGLSTSRLTILILGYVVKTLLYEERPLRRIPWLVRFALKGRRQDFRAPSPKQWLIYTGS